MFLSVFASFGALLGLYLSSSQAISNTNNYYYLNSTKYFNTQPVQPPVTLTPIRCTAASGTSVTFEINASNYTSFYNQTSTSYVESTYNFYSEVNDNYVSIGSIAFRPIYNSDTQSFNFKFRYTFDDIYNLKICVDVRNTNSSFNDLVLNLHDDYYRDVYYWETPYISGTPYQYFVTSSQKIYITFITMPLDETEWYGSYQEGYDTGYDEGYATGEATGYTNGYTQALEQGSTASVIFSGILSIALVPVNFFLGILNFEIFGINVGAFVSALLTIAIIVIVTRIIFNGGNGSGDSK